MIVDYLKDIMSHTQALGIIDLIRVEGTATETKLNAIDNNRTVVIQAKTHKPIKEFIGVFGMPSLGNLSTILGISEYKENANVTITQKSPGELSGIHFENAAGDFKNDYRFMSQALANDKLKQVTFKGASWLATIIPTQASIQKFGFQAQMNSDETVFTFSVENGDLRFYFGDHSSHAGNFVFAKSVNANFKHQWAWPISVFKSIMALHGSKQIKFSDEGVMMICVDSGNIAYEYIIPAILK